MVVVVGRTVVDVDADLVAVDTAFVSTAAGRGAAASPHASDRKIIPGSSTNSDLRPCPPERPRWRIEPMEQLTPHRWKLTFETKEDENHCDMVVHLDAGDRSLSGRGQSRRNPADPAVPQVGEELAAARALHDLANHLTEDAWETIETFSSDD